MKSVSVVIPNYNGQQLLAKHLPAVIHALRSGDEIVIVDDASTDTSVAWLKTHFHLNEELSGQISVNERTILLRVIPQTTNKRFAATCNHGVEQARHEYIFLLNSDVSPHADVLEFLLPHFDDPNVFAVGCREDEHGVTGGKNRLWFARGMFMHARATDFSSGETAWVSGGSGVFHKPKWYLLGGFDVGFSPAYWEDVDLSFRAGKHGWKVLFEEHAVVDHFHETTNQTTFGQKRIAQISWRNAQRFTWKNGTFLQKILYIVWQPYWWWKRKYVTEKSS